MSLDIEKYQPTIDAILSVADLEQVSVKKIRRALQELFSVSFDEDKKPINDFILERYHNLLDKREAAKTRKVEDEDAKLALRLHNEDNGSRRAARTAASSSKVTKPRKKRDPNAPPRETALTTTKLNLSEKLSTLLNTTEKLPRPQVVKKIWEYVKEHNLQNPNDKRQIICDDKMGAVFGPKVGAFEMNKVLSSHLYKDGE